MKKTKLIDWYFGENFKFISLFPIVFNSASPERSLLGFEYYYGGLKIELCFINLQIKEQSYEYKGH